jgi:hypothetical protein
MTEAHKPFNDTGAVDTTANTKNLVASPDVLAALNAATMNGFGPPAVYRPQGITLGPAVFLSIILVQSLFLIATAVVMTVLVTRPELIQRWLDPAGPVQARAAAVGGGTPVKRVESLDRLPKPEAGAATRVQLDFTRPIQVVSGTPTRVDFRLIPSGAYKGRLVLSFRGLPNGTTLTGATRLGTETWSLDGSQDPNIFLTVPLSAQGPFELEIALRNPDGDLFFSEVTSIIALPNGRQGGQPQLDEVSALYLLDFARSQLKNGDIQSARQLFQSASERGNAQAAFELAQTYEQTDGKELTKPVKQRALYWYLEARRLGHPDAGAQFAALLNAPASGEAPASK